MECGQCLQTWDLTIRNFLCHDRGCPTCASSGFNPNKESVVYVLKINGHNKFTGYGITNSFEGRFRTHKTSFKQTNSYIEDYFLIPVSGYAAREIEKHIKENFILNRQEIIGFKQESTLYELYDEVVKFVRNSTYGNLEQNS